MAKRSLTVTQIDPRTRKSRELAKFTLERNGKIREEYKDTRFRLDMRRGVKTHGRTFKPKDGYKFMGALEKVFSARSMFDVVRS